MAKNKLLTDAIRGILNESGPDPVPGRASLDLSYDEVGGPIVSANAEKLDFAKSIKAGQARLPQAGGPGPEKNPTKYKKVDDIDPKKDLGEEEEPEEDDDKEDVKEDDSKLPAWLKAKAKSDDDDDDSEDNDESDEDDDEKKDVKEEKDEDSDDDDESEDGEDDDEKEVNEDYFNSRYAEADKLAEESFNSIFAGKKLSEDFKKKLASVFESTINLKMDVIKEHLEAHYQVALDNQVKQVTESITDKVDSFLSFVAEEWLEENAVAIERGIKSELVEDFIVGFKSLCEQHYIEIPEKKVNVVEALAERVDDLVEQLNVTLNNNISLTEELNSLKKQIAISEAANGLVDSKASKFKKLAENLDYSEDFSQKLETLKENISGNNVSIKKTTLTEDVDVNNNNNNTSTKDDLVESVKTILDRVSK